MVSSSPDIATLTETSFARACRFAPPCTRETDAYNEVQQEDAFETLQDMDINDNRAESSVTGNRKLRNSIWMTGETLRKLSGDDQELKESFVRVELGRGGRGYCCGAM